MEDKKLYYICLIFSLISIVSLLIFSYLSKPKKVPLSSINEGYIGKDVRVSGEISERYLTDEGHFFFHVKDGRGEINAVVFKDSFREMGLKPEILNNGRKVVLEGEISRHNGKLQIIPDKIIL